MSEDIDLTQNKINPKKLFYVLSIGWSLLVLAGTLPQVLEDFSNWKRADRSDFSRQMDDLRTREWQSCSNSNPISVAESERLKACLYKSRSGLHSERGRDWCRKLSIRACAYVYADSNDAFSRNMTKNYQTHNSLLGKTFRWLSYTHYSGLFWVMILLLISGPLAFAFGPRAWFYFKSWMMDK
jgi:hypothetical protein